MQSSPHNQFTFRPLPPPPPPPHACTCARKPPPTVDSLQRRSMTTRSQPSPAAPAPPTSTQDSVHLHNSWVLNSNIPLETRYLSYYWWHYIWILTVPNGRNSFHHSCLRKNTNMNHYTQSGASVKGQISSQADRKQWFRHTHRHGPKHMHESTWNNRYIITSFSDTAKNKRKQWSELSL